VREKEHNLGFVEKKIEEKQNYPSTIISLYRRTSVCHVLIYSKEWTNNEPYSCFIWLLFSWYKLKLKKKNKRKMTKQKGIVVTGNQSLQRFGISFYVGWHVDCCHHYSLTAWWHPITTAVWYFFSRRLAWRWFLKCFFYFKIIFFLFFKIYFYLYYISKTI